MRKNHTLHLGDNLVTLKTYPDNHFDSIIADPPYGIEFLGKEWDKHTGTLDLYKECLRVLKPGGYMLAFSAARTYHQLASNIELAGFEIRDQLMWLYSSGFPKAQDIGKAIQKRLGVEEKEPYMYTIPGIGGTATTEPYEMCVGNTVCTSPLAKEWAGFKTALKPAHEPIVMARKPFKGSTIDNVLKNGLGALNIDATRVPWADADPLQEWNNKYLGADWQVGGPTFQGTSHAEQKKKKSDRPHGGTDGIRRDLPGEEVTTNQCYLHGSYDPNSISGRYPSNVIGEVAEDIQKYFMNPQDPPKKKKSDRPQAGSRTKTFGTDIGSSGVSGGEKEEGWECDNGGRYPSNVIGEVEEGYQKYFYCPKVSRKERHSGFTELPTPDPSGKYDRSKQPLNANERIQTKIGNNHPTVKPVALMDYLIKLVTPPSTPELQRKVLDPFMGSGSTGMAATALGHHFTGCELDPKYVAIAETRIEAWNKPDDEDLVENNFNELFDSTEF